MAQEKTSKKLFLSKEETQNLSFRKLTIGYLKDLVEKDINIYVCQNVCPRLGIKPEDVGKLSDDFDYLELKEKDAKTS